MKLQQEIGKLAETVLAGDYEYPKIKISQYCKNIRKKLGLTAEQLAKQMGTSRAYVWKVESGQSDKPSVVVLTKLAKNYDLSAKDLLKLDVDEHIVKMAGEARFGRDLSWDNEFKSELLKEFQNNFLFPNDYKTDFIYDD